MDLNDLYDFIVETIAPAWTQQLGLKVESGNDDYDSLVTLALPWSDAVYQTGVALSAQVITAAADVAGRLAVAWDRFRSEGDFYQSIWTVQQVTTIQAGMFDHEGDVIIKAKVTEGGDKLAFCRITMRSREVDEDVVVVTATYQMD
ncbi:hypothetical protein ACIBG4_16110 [Nonomuraea sp. NPDC050383]|uniref:hypothetical protein n=1 Tax=Nonomuraea sp. NPDC050383 TaxID=3364362 RepID=UPI0037B1D82A